MFVGLFWKILSFGGVVGGGDIVLVVCGGFGLWGLGCCGWCGCFWGGGWVLFLGGFCVFLFVCVVWGFLFLVFCVFWFGFWWVGVGVGFGVWVLVLGGGGGGWVGLLGFVCGVGGVWVGVFLLVWCFIVCFGFFWVVVFFLVVGVVWVVFSGVVLGCVWFCGVGGGGMLVCLGGGGFFLVFFFVVFVFGGGLVLGWVVVGATIFKLRIRQELK